MNKDITHDAAMNIKSVSLVVELIKEKINTGYSGEMLDLLQSLCA